ncbi:MAG: Diaminopimelate epimerase [Bacteriovoracaceae bacterium]|nr:Diaminopimelate epimerase [Bacteriovoracaceae bacterium]
MHGCHNDYIYLDNIDGKILTDFSKLAVKVSDRKTGIGSDGLIVLEKPENPKCLVKMKMFNADGSEGKMCGNGIRCVAKLAFEKYGKQESYKIETASGVRECFILDSSDPKRFIVKVNMGRPSFLPTSLPVLFDDMMVLGEEFEVEDQTFKINCVSMGNPHCVIFVDDVDKFDVARYGSKIEKHEVFPEGVNVEFVEVRNGEVKQRTWERGSGETQACGTGACAVGVFLIMGGKMKSPVKIQLRGGSLTIDWDGLHEVWLSGEAVTESTGII